MPFRAEMFAIYVEYNIAPIPIWARNILHAFFAIQQIWKISVHINFSLGLGIYVLI